MPHILKNDNLEIHIGLPKENYNFSRFDWTGKIETVKFQDKLVSGVEKTDCKDEQNYGKGFYNEFGIDTALGFEETSIGSWFHKIGIGLLKKEELNYFFHKKHEVIPSEFIINTQSNKIVIQCNSKVANGYSYILKKEIELFESSFRVKYNMQNTGRKAINTTEYNHNFLAINKDLIGSNYILKFPFLLKPKLFEETVNPEEKINIGENEIKFNGIINDEFFFSNLTGSENVEASWELINLKNNIGISESGSFKTSKVNLWGCKHVICPELFFNIAIEPNQSIEWTRTYNVYNI
ncbi:hypothetical protein [Lutibacter sp.]|uniref:hypothetical protein n=1 Tax=Lutibacter sp. TaxID=1925666 RepID=UPI003564B0FA